MWYNKIVTFLLRSPLHGMVSSGLMLINYTGHKSGKQYSVPVNFVYQEEDILLTVSFKDRIWWRSLREDVRATVRLGGKDVPATMEVYEDDEDVAHYLTVFFDRAPRMAGYLQVSLDESNRPNAHELAAAAAKRVIVRTILQQPE